MALNRRYLAKLALQILSLNLVLFSYQNCGESFTPVGSADFASVSLQAPSLEITSSPQAQTRQTTASFSFSAEANRFSQIASIQCALDGAAAADCTAGLTLNTLSDGAHRLTVYAVDSRGNRSQELTHDWLVDATNPTVSVTMPPPAVIGSTTLNVTFLATDNGSGIESVVCTLDNNTVVCAGGAISLTGLTSGAHALRITATDRVQNSAVTNLNFSVDLEAPTVATLTGPLNPTNQTSATFQYTGTDGGVVITQFECSPLFGYWDDMHFAENVISPLNTMHIYIDRVRLMPGWPDTANGPPF